MELKVLASAKYKVTAATDRGKCPVQEALLEGEESTTAWREKLLNMIDDISDFGLHEAPSIWSKCVDAENGIYELKAGKLRLFYFKGHGSIVLVCTSLSRKVSQKVNKADVKKAISIKNQYQDAVDSNEVSFITDEE
ncbi:MAG: hypothetical protein ABI475_08470 [Methylophilaceae bacterium]